MIELHERVAAWAVAVTTSVIFPILVFLVPRVQSLGLSTKFASVAAAALSSFGLYKGVVEAMFWMFGKVQLIRRLLLGSAFLEGTWVGHYVRSGLHRFTIETIDQRDGETRIEGREFDENLKTRADWSSESCFVDVRRGRLIYVYSCDVYDTNHQQNGIGVFRIVQSRKGEPRDKLDGYAVDMVDGQKDPNTEHRISMDFVSDADALKQAKAIFGVGRVPQATEAAQ
jgi:hypothetical protein